MATAPDALRGGLLDLSAFALAELTDLLRRTPPEQARGLLLALGPDLMAYRASGASALAADWFEEIREESHPRSRYTARAFPWHRHEEFSRALVWATEPLEWDDPVLTEALTRLGTAVEYETFDAFTGSVDGNVESDREAIGWSRNANYGTACKFCRMLADRGAVYRKEESARFAAHTNCQCTCVPVFVNGSRGPEASVMQYRASRRYRTKAEREANNARIRKYLNANYSDFPG